MPRTTTCTRRTAALGLIALALSLLLLCATAAAGAALTALPRSDYSVRAACASPTPGHAGCLALQLVALTPQAQAHDHPLAVGRASRSSAPSPAEGDFGLRPQDLHSAYALPTASSTEQTIALVDAYNDPTAEADLNAYDREFALPACTASGGCFTKVNQRGETANLPFPRTSAELEAARSSHNKATVEEAEEAEGWGVEISLDMETAHAICQVHCRILLVEASSSSFADLEAAESTAERLGATEVSNSWGGPELGEPAAPPSGSAFNDPGVVITASAGDDGYLGWAASRPEERGFTEFPAASRNVVAVGGTRLSLSPTGAWAGESVWNDGGERNGVRVGHGAGGGGCSAVFSAPPWQRALPDWLSVGCGELRSVADVSADADPYSGLAVYDSSQECELEYREAEVTHVLHWCTIGGTSLSSPLIASVFGLAGGAHGVSYPAQTLYERALADPVALHDVSTGSNGECQRAFDDETGESGCTAAEEGLSCTLEAKCLARVGYDGPSGLGTPIGVAAFQPSAESEEAQRKKAELEKTEAEKAAAEKAAAEKAERERLEREQAERERAESERAEGERSEGETAERERSGALTKEPTLGSSGTGTGAGTPTPAPAPASPPSILAPVLPGPSPLTPTPAPRISALALTRQALAALARPRPRMTAIGFAFTISPAAQVRVTVARRVRVQGRLRWQTVRTFTASATRGRDGWRLRGGGTLASGRYRLTLSPTHGVADSILFRSP